MSIPTNIKFDDFLKAVPLLASKKGWTCKFFNSDGSAIRFELFKSSADKEPSKMWVVHEDKKEKKIYSKDLKKACDNIGVTKKDFEVLIKNKFKQI